LVFLFSKGYGVGRSASSVRGPRLMALLRRPHDSHIARRSRGTGKITITQSKVSLCPPPLCALSHIAGACCQQKNAAIGRTKRALTIAIRLTAHHRVHETKAMIRSPAAASELPIRNAPVRWLILPSESPMAKAHPKTSNPAKPAQEIRSRAYAMEAIFPVGFMPYLTPTAQISPPRPCRRPRTWSPCRTSSPADPSQPATLR